MKQFFTLLLVGLLAVSCNKEQFEEHEPQVLHLEVADHIIEGTNEEWARAFTEKLKNRFQWRSHRRTVDGTTYQILWWAGKGQYTIKDWQGEGGVISRSDFNSGHSIINQFGYPSSYAGAAEYAHDQIMFKHYHYIVDARARYKHRWKEYTDTPFSWHGLLPILKYTQGNTEYLIMKDPNREKYAVGYLRENGSFKSLHGGGAEHSINWTGHGYRERGPFREDDFFKSAEGMVDWFHRLTQDHGGGIDSGTPVLSWRNDPNYAGLDFEDIHDYVTAFLRDAKSYGYNFPENPRETRPIDYRVRLQPLWDGVIGIAYVDCDYFGIFIDINESWWERATIGQRMIGVYHEIGHSTMFWTHSRRYGDIMYSGLDHDANMTYELFKELSQRFFTGEGQVPACGAQGPYGKEHDHEYDKEGRIIIKD